MPASTRPVISLAKGALAYSFASALTRVVSLFLLPVYTAYLTPAEYGVIALLVVLISIVIPVVSLGLGVSISLIYFEQDAADHRARTVWTAFTVLFTVGLGVLLLIVNEAGEISQLISGNEDAANLVSLAAVTAWLATITQPFATHLQLERRLSAYLVGTLAAAAALVAGNLWLVVGLNQGATGVVKSQLIAQIISTIVFAAATSLRLRPAYSLALSCRLLKLGLPFAPSFASLLILQQANQIMLKTIDGLGTLGIYSIGASMGTAISFAVTGFTSAWPSIFLPYANQPEAARDLIRRISVIYVAGVGGLSLLFFVWARPVIFLLTTTSFHDAYLVVGLASCAQFFLGFFSLLLPPVYFAKQVGAVSLTQTIAAALLVPLAWILISWAPLVGTGLGLAAGFALMCLAQYCWNRWQHRNYLQIGYPWARFAAFGAAYVLVAIGFTVPRTAGFALDVALATVGTLLAATIAVSLLDLHDRKALWDMARAAVKWRT